MVSDVVVHFDFVCCCHSNAVSALYKTMDSQQYPIDHPFNNMSKNKLLDGEGGGLIPSKMSRECERERERKASG